MVEHRVKARRSSAKNQRRLGAPLGATSLAAACTDMFLNSLAAARHQTIFESKTTGNVYQYRNNRGYNKKMRAETHTAIIGDKNRRGSGWYSTRGVFRSAAYRWRMPIDCRAQIAECRRTDRNEFLSGRCVTRADGSK